MIYLRPSRRIKDTQPAGNIVISESLLDEHLSHIAYFVGDKRPFALRIEASNGVVLDEHSTTATELSVRIYTSEGVDVTEFVTSLNPSWQIGAEAVGQGLSYTVQASSLKSWHTKIVVTTSAARILDAMGKLQSKTAEEQRLLERLTIDTSIEVRRDFVLLQRIPTAELIRDTLKLDKEFIAATTGKQGAPGKDGKSVTLGEVTATLKKDTEFIRAVTGPQGVQGPRGIQGPQGAKGADGTPGAPGKDGKSVTLGEVTATLKNDTEFIRAVTGPQGVQGPRGIQGPQGVKGADGKQGDKGEPGKDATNVRPNLWLSDVKIYPNMGHGADNVHVTYKGDGGYRVTKHDKMYVVVSMYSDKLQEDKTTKTIITSWRVVGASRQELLEEKYLKNKNGRYYITKNTEHKEVNVRGTLYAHPWRGDENHWIDGDWIEFADVKVELVEDGDILEPTAYIPNIPSLDYLSSSTAQKITQESIYLSRIQNGMARYDDFNQVRKIVEGHQVNWETLDDNYLRPIRKQQEDLRTKQNESEQRLGDVEQDIIKFAYRAVGTSSSEWSDYTNNEYVGGGHKPDPWGGGGIDGYIRIVHNYEIYRAMNNIPSTHIEQSKKILRDKEYKIGDKYHRDASATIVYDIQTLDGIGRGQARHWRLFTTPHAASILRYGNRTTMGNPDMQGHQVGSYYNVVLDRGTTYDIYAHNDGWGKYKLYIAKNGAYK